MCVFQFSDAMIHHELAFVKWLVDIFFLHAFRWAFRAGIAVAKLGEVVPLSSNLPAVCNACA
jgi:hypothetical protein